MSSVYSTDVLLIVFEACTTIDILNESRRRLNETKKGNSKNKTLTNTHIYAYTRTEIVYFRQRFIRPQASFHSMSILRSIRIESKGQYAMSVSHSVVFISEKKKCHRKYSEDNYTVCLV